MKRRAYISGIAALCLPAFLAAFVASPAAAQAQQPNNGPPPAQALEIAPPIITLSANPGQTVKHEISLRNISNTSLLVRGQVNDFVASGEDGTPKIIFDETEENPRSLKKWISPFANLTTTPRQIKKIPLAITVPANAAPGGYYAVVRFTGTPPELEDTGVSLSASVGSLVLLTVNGKAERKLAIEEFSVSKDGGKGSLFETAPVDFTLRLKNGGNIHEQPRGYAEITNMFGKKIAIVNFNQPPRNILPGSVRKFDSSLNSSVIGNKILFGRYSANLKMTYGENGQTVNSSLTFWVIPYRLMAIAIATLIVGFIVLRFAIKRYNQSIIRKAQGGSKKRK